MLEHPVEILPHARETVEVLAGDFRLILITKGDLLHQERKLAQSGLGDFFSAVEIVSDKAAATYATVFARHGTGAAEALMAGNSLRSDVIPALEAGAFGVYVPHGVTWALEAAEEPLGAARYSRIADLSALPALVAGLSRLPHS
jgi:putative hydrolase of the HAD superfamily